MAASKILLIIEDDRGIFEALEELLMAEGYAVFHAANGQEGLAWLRHAKILPRVILLDLKMPVMDGFEFREAQQQDSRLSDIPVVVMTADGYKEAQKRQIGAIAYIKKPLNIADVIEKISPFFNP